MKKIIELTHEIERKKMTIICITHNLDILNQNL